LEKFDESNNFDAELFNVIDPAVLNKLHEEIDYQVDVDKSKSEREINMAVIGHVDHGKSTLMGHLLYL
jgi:elongation factor 1 alpha-like protein|tara:strand:+ start:280 stop:483 length:204 start_codon:yes stop_codon:yes gene_type:complete